MKARRRGTNLMVFLAFVLIALVELLRTWNPFETLFWISLGAVLYFADFTPHRWWRE